MSQEFQKMQQLQTEMKQGREDRAAATRDFDDLRTMEENSKLEFEQHTKQQEEAPQEVESEDEWDQMLKDGRRKKQVFRLEVQASLR